MSAEATHEVQVTQELLAALRSIDRWLKAFDVRVDSSLQIQIDAAIAKALPESDAGEDLQSDENFDRMADRL